MRMRIAQFNVENLFDRAAVMNLDNPDEGKPILEAFADINEHLLKPVYNDADKKAIVTALKILGLEKSDESEFVVLRQNHGHLLKRSKGQVTVVADGRAAWVGSVDLKEGPVTATATRMTAKVIGEVAPDILAVEEIEGMDALRSFNRARLHAFDAEYDHLMTVRGNDERPIDVALLTRNGNVIESIVSHVDDAANGKPIFSRDCVEYTVQAGNETILVMVNHFKSQGYGKPKDNNAKRKAQAQRVRDIYDQRRAEGIKNIVILGDFNDVATSDTLSPLLGNGSDLKDISTHSMFAPDGAGTYRDGKKLDYILLSPALYAKVVSGGTCHKGMLKDPDRFTEIRSESDAASDHAALFADIDL